MDAFDRILETLGLSNQATAYFVGVIVALLLLVAGRFLLPKPKRSALRLPLFALIGHFALMLGRNTLSENSSLAQLVALSALFLLLISIGRSGFLIVVWSTISRRFGRPMPKIFGDIIQAGIYAGALFVTLQAAGVEMSSLLTTSALLTAVIGFALQDTLGNLFAGLAIQAQRPFEVGDWIQFDDNADNVGMVVEINWRAARVLTLDQIEVTVPNNQLAKAPIRNFTKPMVEARRIVYTYAPYAVPPRRVQRYVLNAISDVDGVLDDPAPSVIPNEFDERGVRYQVRYFINDFLRRETIDADVRERIWYALTRAEIQIPVPQRFVHLHEETQEEEELVHAQQVKQRRKLLQKVDLLSTLPDDALATLAELSEIRLYDDAEAIIREGDADQELYIVIRGMVAITVSKGDGRRVEVARLGPGQFFGEMSLMTGEKRRATVRAIRECELLSVGKEAFHRVFDLHPNMMEAMSETLAKREAQLGKIADEAGDTGPGEDEDDDRRSAELLTRIRDFFSL